jgi:hypothetical protein
MPLLLPPRDKFVTHTIFGRKFSVDFRTREDWSTECVDLVAPDGLVFFAGGSLCETRAGAGVFSDILNVRESYAAGSHATVFQYEIYAILAYLSTEQYQSALIVGLLFWPLNRMSCLPELYNTAGIRFRNWLCLTEFDWCGSLDTVVSMGMRRPTYLQERDQVLLLRGRSLVFRWHLRVSNGGSGSGYLNHTAPHGAWRLLVVSQECG